MKYIASAPGKIIITGEHFVVHGSYALAAAVQKRVSVVAEPSESLQIVSKSLGLKASPPEIPSTLLPVYKTVEAIFKYLGERRALRLIIDSEIPVSSGLGSSSAVSVATAAATSALLGHALEEQDIVKLAMTGEKMVHRNPSGIDVNIAAYGDAILFRRGESPEAVKIENPIQFIVTDTGLQRRTSDMIQHVAEVRRQYPRLFDGLVRSTSHLSELAKERLIKGDLEELGAILNLNHLSLKWIGVSNDLIDRIVDEALRIGSLGSKLTGGGGGGCVLILPKSGDVNRVVDWMKSIGYDSFVTDLPVDGVRVWREES